MRSDERNGASVLERAFRVLDVFTPLGRDLGLAEIARRTQLPKTTVYRLANQLVDLGALERCDDKYRLGIHLFEMGSAVSRQRRLREAALPFMEDLYEATHETVHLGVLDGNNVLYIEKISGRRSSPIATQIGTRKPVYCTALGKAILAFSPRPVLEEILGLPLSRRTPHTISTPEALMREVARIRSAGISYDREEFALGTTCVAAPLVAGDGYAEAALSITGPTSRFNADQFAIALRTAGLGLSRALSTIP
jgi:DNA-binding IclR family transcriptional regulator